VCGYVHVIGTSQNIQCYQNAWVISKFCTLYVFSLKINLFYKIHLQTFNVISIVLYHSGPTFGQVLYSCQDAFVFDASDYSGHLIRHLINASEAFPTEWFLQFWEQVKVWWAHVRTVWRVGKHLPSILFQTFRYCTWSMRPRFIVQNEDTGCEHGGPFFGESLDAKHLAETFCSMPLLQWIPEAICLLLLLHSCHKPKSSWA